MLKTPSGFPASPPRALEGLSGAALQVRSRTPTRETPPSNAVVVREATVHRRAHESRGTSSPQD